MKRTFEYDSAEHTYVIPEIGMQQAMIILGGTAGSTLPDDERIRSLLQSIDGRDPFDVEFILRSIAWADAFNFLLGEFQKAPAFFGQPSGTPESPTPVSQSGSEPTA